jgi:hypothetical protein
VQEEPEKVQKLLNIALSNFKMVLAEKDEHNLYAAHGAAAVLAEQATRADPARMEYLIHAKKIFDKVESPPLPRISNVPPRIILTLPFFFLFFFVPRK